MTVMSETGCRETLAKAPTSAGRKVLRVLALPRGEEAPPLFYYEPALGGEPDEGEEVGHEDAEGGGLRARIKRWRHGLQRAEQGAPSRLRETFRWVRSKLPADERLLRSLRTADALELVHPPSLPAEELNDAWAAYLNSRFRRFVGGFIVYLLLLVPTAALAFAPGPNIIGIWVAYRLIAHGLALYGIVRARQGRVPILDETSEVLEGEIIAEKKQAERVQKHFGLKGLKGRLKRERVLARLRHREKKRAEPVVDEEARP